MTGLSYYSGPRNQSRNIGIAVLAVWTIVYGLLCIPGYSSRSWPPLPRIWEAMGWMWVFAIPAFTLIVPRGWTSRISLLVYALVTANIDAWTSPYANMNPHPRFDVELWIDNMILTVPIHLVATAALALLMRLEYYLFDFGPQRPRRRAIALSSILAAAAAFPFTYDAIARKHDNFIGSQIADVDWASGNAEIFTREPEIYKESGDHEFVWFFDMGTGLPLKESWFQLYEPGYNAELRRLAAARGAPPWSAAGHIVSEADMISMLRSKSMKKITAYPCTLSPNIVLLWGGGTTPWGEDYGGGGTGLILASRFQDIMDQFPMYNDSTAPAFIGRLPKYPGVIFVRCGASVIACDRFAVIQQVTDDK